VPVNEKPVTERPCGLTRSEARNAAHARAQKTAIEVRESLLLDGTAGGHTNAAIAGRLGYASPHVVADLLAMGGAPLLLGDPEAFGPEFARRFHVAKLAELEAGAGAADPQRALHQLVRQIGKAQERLDEDLLDDGKVNQHGAHAASLLSMATLCMRAYALSRAAAKGEP
jgi:hypothetical protein